MPWQKRWKADDETQSEKPQSVEHKQAQDVLGTRSEGHADSRFMLALGHGKGHHAKNTDSGEHEGHEADDAHQDSDIRKTDDLIGDEVIQRQYIENGLVRVEVGDGGADKGNKRFGVGSGANRNVGA